MAFESWALFVIVGTVAAVSPGPNVLIVVSHALRYGWVNSLATIAGNLVCLFLVALIAALGVGAFLQATPLAYLVLKSAGACYLIVLGARSIWTSGRTEAGGAAALSEPMGQGAPPDRFRLAREAFVVSSSNTKSILFFTAVFPQFIDPAAPVAGQFALLFATAIVLVAVVHGTYALLAASLRAQLFAPGRRRMVARGIGLCFIGLGLGLLLSA